MIFVRDNYYMAVQQQPLISDNRYKKSTLSIAKLAAHYNINPNTVIRLNRETGTMSMTNQADLKNHALRY